MNPNNKEKTIHSVLIIENTENLYIVENSGVKTTIENILTKNTETEDLKEELKSEPESENEQHEDVTGSFLELQLDAENLHNDKDSNLVFVESIFDGDCKSESEPKANSNDISSENDNLLNYFFDEFDGDQNSGDCSESETEEIHENSGSEKSFLDNKLTPEEKSKSLQRKTKESQQKVFKCKFCEINFNTKKKFKKHDCPSRQSIMENNKFICNICGKELLRDSYTYHMTTHSANRKLSFNCDHDNCTKSFYTKQHLTQHKKSHSGEFKYNCDVCEKRFVQKHHRDRHLSIHTGDKKHKCTTCAESFLIKHQLVRHMAKHGIIPPMFKCTECQKEFSRRYYLEQHQKIHRGEATFKCEFPDCQSSFTMKQHYVAHTATHSEIRPFKCDQKGCEKGFTLRTYLTQHKLTHSTEKKYSFVCEICNKALSRKIDLERHLILHTGSKKFMCQYCGKTFSLKSYLTNHMHIHSQAEGTIVCEVCKKIFSRLSDLKRHQITHSEEKPYRCIYCSKTYRHKNQLTRHTCQHTGEKPESYNCPHCSKELTKKYYLKQHIQMMHGTDLKHFCETCQKGFPTLNQKLRHVKVHTTSKLKNENTPNVLLQEDFGFVEQTTNEIINNIASVEQQVILQQPDQYRRNLSDGSQLPHLVQMQEQSDKHNFQEFLIVEQVSELPPYDLTIQNNRYYTVE